MTEPHTLIPPPLYGDTARRWQNRKECSHKKPNMLAPWSWASQPEEAWEINVCGFHHPVCDVLLQQLALTNTDTLAAHLHYRCVQHLALACSSYSCKDLKKRKAKICLVVLSLSSSPSPFLGISSFWQSTEFIWVERNAMCILILCHLATESAQLRQEGGTNSIQSCVINLFVCLQS